MNRVAHQTETPQNVDEAYVSIHRLDIEVEHPSVPASTVHMAFLHTLYTRQTQGTSRRQMPRAFVVTCSCCAPDCPLFTASTVRRSRARQISSTGSMNGSTELSNAYANTAATCALHQFQDRRQALRTKSARERGAHTTTKLQDLHKQAARKCMEQVQRGNHVRFEWTTWHGNTASSLMLKRFGV